MIRSRHIKFFALPVRLPVVFVVSRWLSRCRSFRIPHSPFRIVLALVVVALAAGSARGDEADEALGKYKEPVDEAISRGLEFLAKKQTPDGSFGTGGGANTAVTSLCVMSFLAKGYTPGAEPYGDVINRAVDNVISSQQSNGLLVRGGWPMYEHNISTLMLSEVSGMVDRGRQKRLDPALSKALKLILDAQRIAKPAGSAGGWRYQPTSGDSDISCTGWALMSLRSARNNGAAVPKQAIDLAVQYVKKCRMPDGGFAYQPGGGSGMARTGTALLCLELSGLHRDEITIGAGDWILKNPPRGPGDSFFYYGLYYCSQGMFQLGGDHWEQFGDHMYRMMLKLQQEDGSWPPSGEYGERTYSTAMAILAMSVAYRQLPIYQR
jgi:hypothetical protein